MNFVKLKCNRKYAFYILVNLKHFVSIGFNYNCYFGDVSGGANATFIGHSLYCKCAVE